MRFAAKKKLKELAQTAKITGGPVGICTSEAFTQKWSFWTLFSPILYAPSGFKLENASKTVESTRKHPILYTCSGKRLENGRKHPQTPREIRVSQKKRRKTPQNTSTRPKTARKRHKKVLEKHKKARPDCKTHLSDWWVLHLLKNGHFGPFFHRSCRKPL